MSNSCISEMFVLEMYVLYSYPMVRSYQRRKGYQR